MKNRWFHVMMVQAYPPSRTSSPPVLGNWFIDVHEAASRPELMHVLETFDGLPATSDTLWPLVNLLDNTDGWAITGPPGDSFLHADEVSRVFTLLQREDDEVEPCPSGCVECTAYLDAMRCIDVLTQFPGKMGLCAAATAGMIHI